jgi:ribA/ribD-fused uncharacterized protein
LPEIESQISGLLQFAAQNPDKDFIVSKIGTGLAGFSEQEIKGLFAGKDIPANVKMPQGWSAAPAAARTAPARRKITNWKTPETSFLSNFHPADVEFEGVRYPTVEHAYQAAKSLDPKIRAGISKLKTAADAKAAGKRLAMRKDWNQIKDQVMEELTRKKFSDEKLAALLEGTGDADLIHSNWWNDTYWGADEKTGAGDNRLGKILMKLRDERRKGRS